MQTLEVRQLRRIPRFAQGIDPGANKCAGPAAKHGLFAEQVPFPFFTERSFSYPSPGTTDRLRPGQRHPFGPPPSVPVHGTTSPYSAAVDPLHPPPPPPPLRCP